MKNQIIIEGVDRMGKSTLISAIQHKYGYFHNVHYSKPKILKYYEDFPDPKKLFQLDQYRSMFTIINSGIRTIFDRGHLGEVVYAPLYRGYSGDYVYDFESEVNTSNTKLILLTTSDWSFVEDDGQSLDFNRKEEEQDKFIDAFNRSSIKDKMIVDVSAGNGRRKDVEQILEEIVEKGLQDD